MSLTFGLAGKLCFPFPIQRRPVPRRASRRGGWARSSRSWHPYTASTRRWPGRTSRGGHRCWSPLLGRTSPMRWRRRGSRPLSWRGRTRTLLLLPLPLLRGTPNLPDREGDPALPHRIGASDLPSQAWTWWLSRKILHQRENRCYAMLCLKPPKTPKTLASPSLTTNPHIFMYLLEFLTVQRPVY